MKNKEYAQSIDVTNFLNGVCVDFKGRYLMVSRYRGVGRPRKADYEEYSTIDEYRDLQCADLLGCGFTANYIPNK